MHVCSCSMVESDSDNLQKAQILWYYQQDKFRILWKWKCKTFDICEMWFVFILNSSCHLTQILTTLSVCSSGCACTDPTYINTGVGCVCSLSVLNYRVAQISITPLPVCHGFMLKHDLKGFGGDISARPAETTRDAAHGVSSLHSLTLLYQEKRHSDRPYGRVKPDWKTIQREKEPQTLTASLSVQVFM